MNTVKESAKECRICSGKVSHLFNGLILGKYNISYYKCDACGFVQTENPFWLKEAYSSSINLSDTGLVMRNLKMIRIVTILIILRFSVAGQYLDYGGGFGLFTRMMRDIGFDFYTADPHTKNLLAPGFDYSGQRIEMVTCFECFEHFEDPVGSLRIMLGNSRNLLFSTDTLPQLVPSLNQWGYYGVSHGQHISFFSKKTIKKLGEIVGLRAYSFRNIHLLTERRMSDIELAGIVALARFGGGEMARLFVKSRTLSDNLLLKNIESLSSRGAKNNQITSNEGRCSAAYGGQKL